MLQPSYWHVAGDELIFPSAKHLAGGKRFGGFRSCDKTDCPWRRKFDRNALYVLTHRGDMVRSSKGHKNEHDKAKKALDSLPDIAACRRKWEVAEGNSGAKASGVVEAAWAAARNGQAATLDLNPLVERWPSMICVLNWLLH